MTPALGVDIGGVVLHRADYLEEARPSGPVLTDSSEVVGARDGLRRLANELFGNSVFLVSKCGPATEQRTREWLANVGFYEASGVPAANIRFCRRRPEKADICQELGITHFVDDRLEVLSHMDTVPHRFLFQPMAHEVSRFATHVRHVRVVEGWDELCVAIFETVP